MIKEYVDLDVGDKINPDNKIAQDKQTKELNDICNEIIKLQEDSKWRESLSPKRSEYDRRLI